MKNCAISSFEQPNGKPLNLTQPSSFEFDVDPDLLMTQSISALFTLKTVTKKYGFWFKTYNRSQKSNNSPKQKKS